MNTLQKTIFSSLICIVTVGLAATSASAEMFQEQSQSASQKSSVSYSCSGNGCNGSVEMKTSTKLQQDQSQGTGSFHSRGWTRSWDNGTSWRHSRNRDTSGEVTLDWDHRGGTCHVRYSEANARGYKYSTATSCDNGSITVGGLQTGWRYRFQVQKDSEGWSQPITATAI